MKDFKINQNINSTVAYVTVIETGNTYPFELLQCFLTLTQVYI